LKNLSNAGLRVLIMWFLSKEKLHGYVLIKKINQFFKPQIDHNLMTPIRASKMYPVLKRMEEDGLIISSEGMHNNKKVKEYEITPQGYEVYHTIRLQLKEFIESDMWFEFLLDLLVTE